MATENAAACFGNCEQIVVYISGFVLTPEENPKNLSLILPDGKRPQTAKSDHQRSPNDFLGIARRASVYAD